MFTILLACLMLVAVPIIAVQCPRFFPPPPHCDAEREPADTGFDGAGEKTAAAARSEDEIGAYGLSAGMRGHSGRAAETGGDMGTGRKPWDRPERATTTTGMEARSESGTGSEKGKGRPKKPWDPPFAMSPKSGRDTAWRVLGPSASPILDGKGKGRERTESTEDEMEGIFEPMGGHMPVTEPTNHPEPLAPPSHPAPAIVEPSRKSSPATKAGASRVPASPQKKGRARPSLVQTIALVLILTIFIFAFAILIAHCLAWFIVYKTESRLGEVRKGLLRGGDMRVCLCAHG
ncbi:hypothetical protein K458DRAFT_382160 [Lentithecium fluviatile CBS 122367]|uniref:Uncharacterized protein n=1 Tax=Lentithecium fluviatile CBS 122367 TaxID=1168545 RepID=A0A6G1JJK2_9PLEO|nr:hypothetical protein K458DRAFT_382160 [Lentithecium fluviatile CBS 122367]